MKVRNIIVFMIVFLMSTFMSVSTIHAESGSRKEVYRLYIRVEMN